MTFCRSASGSATRHAEILDHRMIGGPNRGSWAVGVGGLHPQVVGVGGLHPQVV
jgi:hypothetical protein